MVDATNPHITYLIPMEPITSLHPSQPHLVNPKDLESPPTPPNGVWRMGEKTKPRHLVAMLQQARYRQPLDLATEMTGHMEIREIIETIMEIDEITINLGGGQGYMNGYMKQGKE